jgi:hypothetical protein
MRRFEPLQQYLCVAWMIRKHMRNRNYSGIEEPPNKTVFPTLLIEAYG